MQVRSVSIAAIIAAALAVMPALASAQAASPPATSSGAAAPAVKPATNSVEARIKSLHDQLKITSAEEPQWDAVAQAMRDSANNTATLITDRAKQAKSMTAIDDLHSYRAILQSHVDGIDKLTSAFETLYASMPDAQKKNADAVFGRRPARAKSAKSG
jgi:Spy/CpxP family protein refolding chaperone